MAKIVPSKNAPSEDFTVTFGVGQVKSTEPLETTNTDLIAEAQNHPWLDVEYDEVEILGGEVVPPAVDPAKDPLSAQNPDNQHLNDPDVVRAARAEADALAPAAIDPVLDQDKTKVEGGVAKTVASVEETAEKAEKSVEAANKKAKA